MTAAGLTAMHNDADQSVLGALRHAFIDALLVAAGVRVVRDDLALEFGQALHRVRFHVELSRELEVVVEFDRALTAATMT